MLESTTLNLLECFEKDGLDFLRKLLKIELLYSFKRKKEKIIVRKKLYLYMSYVVDSTDIYVICWKKNCREKIRDHCNETGLNRRYSLFYM